MHLPSSSTGTDQPQHTSSGSKTNVGAIVGGVVGGIAFLVLLALFFFLRRRRHHAAESAQPNPEAGAATQAQARRNNFSSSQEPMMVEPFIASQTIPVPHTTGASTIPTTTTSSSNLTSPWPPVGSHYGGTTETSSVIDLTAPSLPPLKQDTYGYTRPPTHVPSNSEYVSLLMWIKYRHLNHWLDIGPLVRTLANLGRDPLLACLVAVRPMTSHLLIMQKRRARREITAPLDVDISAIIAYVSPLIVLSDEYIS